MKHKPDIHQLELDYGAAEQKVIELTAQWKQTKLDLREAKVQKKQLHRALVHARSTQKGDSCAFRNRIRKNVVSYCLSEGIDLSTAWTYLYERLRAVSGVNAFELGLGSRASRLSHVAEKGLLEELFELLPELKKLREESETR